MTQEIQQRLYFCAEGRCPSYINRLESHSHREETTSRASQQSRCFAQDILVLKDEAFCLFNVIILFYESHNRLEQL